MNATEKQIQTAVLDHWRACGTPDSLVAAIPNANAFGQAGLTQGLFDLIVFSRTLAPSVGFLELKVEGGKLSKFQQAFRMLLISLSIPYAVTYGRDQPIEVLRTWGAIK